MSNEGILSILIFKKIERSDSFIRHSNFDTRHSIPMIRLDVQARQDPERNLAASESDRTPVICAGSAVWMKIRCTSLSSIS